MFNNNIVNFALRHLPREKWNILSSFCSSLSLPTIGSPIAFSHHNFHLKEFTTNRLPAELLRQFLSFCYPPELPERERQIDFDRRLYWKGSTTLLVFNDLREIVGCIQIVQRSSDCRLPVEYASVIGKNEHKKPFDIRQLVPCENVTEIYRCRRSFSLNKMEAVNVLLMLFKAVWAKTIQLGTAYSLISFDSSKTELRHMYLHKLAFIDPDVSLVFGSNHKRWSLLIKDWKFHEKEYASLSKTHFYIQTWVKMSLKKKHLHISKGAGMQPRKAHQISNSKVVIAKTFTSSKAKLRTRERAGRLRYLKK